MANMHEIKSRIKSIKETMQITKAMKLISAAKLKKARQQLEQVQPFFEKVKATMADILVHSGDVQNIFFDIRNEKEGKKKAYIVITGDKGLAGGYNGNIIKLVEAELEKSQDSRLFVAGHVGRNHFSKDKYNIDVEFDYPVQNPTVARARDIANVILSEFSEGNIDEVYVVYTKMISSILLEPRIIKLLPLELEALKRELDIKDGEDIKQYEKIDETFSYEPSPGKVFEVLVPKYVKGIIYGVFVESFTSEQSARMTAMDNATSNAEEMLQKFNLYYNRARQSAITQEISEIVGGAEAIK